MTKRLLLVAVLSACTTEEPTTQELPGVFARLLANDQARAVIRAHLAETRSHELSLSGHTDRTRLIVRSPRVTGTTLVLETMSRERNLRGKALLATALDGVAKHRVDSFQDVESAMREQRGRDDGASIDDIPLDVQREVVGGYLADHYRRWLDMPLPALGDKTPRQAAASADSRALVERLVDEIEADMGRMPGGDTVDIDGLREELGLEVDDAFVEYDADEPPDAEEWLAIDESLRLSAVEDYHRAIDAGGESAPAHAAMHVIVENQLAAGQPAARDTLARFTRAGVSRHNAIHAIASIVAEAFWRVASNKGTYDAAAVARSLARSAPAAGLDCRTVEAAVGVGSWACRADF